MNLPSVEIPIHDRRVIGIIFDKSHIDKIDFSKTIENGISELVISHDDMTSVMWDIDDSGEIPDFLANIPYERIHTLIELESIKKLTHWLLDE
jgi:hypothetical protein